MRTRKCRTALRAHEGMIKKEVGRLCCRHCQEVTRGLLTECEELSATGKMVSYFDQRHAPIFIDTPSIPVIIHYYSTSYLI